MAKLAKSLMIQGCTSDAGKSMLVAGLCRVFKRKGVKVAPFKPQNMALNSAVTADGGEIGRAQALQAVACGIEPSIHFNPVLLKPSSDQQSQVIIQGKAVSQLEAKNFASIKPMAFEAVLDSYRQLREEYDLVLIEGAGSPAEVNLRKGDIANMGFAEAVDCPVILIGDIDKGGIFAHLTGTVNLLSESEQNRIKGFVVNKFRGQIKLLQPGIEWLTDHSNKPTLGVLPYLMDLKLDAEDAVNHDAVANTGKIKVKVPVLTRISNHTDFDPLKWHPNVDLEFVPQGQSLQGADLIILPGTKNVRKDCELVKSQGWDKEINSHLRYGGKLFGICGGYQMLGTSLDDPQGIEGPAGCSEGLSLLDFVTLLESEKQLKQATGQFSFGVKSGAITGYEIHCGVSQGAALTKPFAMISDQFGASYPDGVVSDDGQIMGSYLHGLFEQEQTLAAILEWVSGQSVDVQNWADIRESELERFADCLEANLDMAVIEEIIAAS